MTTKYNKKAHDTYIATEAGRQAARDAEKRKRFRVRAKLRMLSEIRTPEEIDAYIGRLNTNYSGDIE